MDDRHLPFTSNCFYHVYNRGNNGENLFYKKDNYHYFLKQYDSYLTDYLETYAYCLLPNHFHLLVRVKEFESTPQLKKGTKTLTDIEEIVSELFRCFFTSYAKSINKQELRTGSLFQKNFKRKPVNNQHYFNRLVYYIHANSQLHGICEDFREYPYSSYARILSDRPSKLFKHEVLSWFGSKEFYTTFHSQKQSLKEINSWIIEDSI